MFIFKWFIYRHHYIFKVLLEMISYIMESIIYFIVIFY